MPAKKVSRSARRVSRPAKKVSVKRVFVYENDGDLRVYPPVIVLTNRSDELEIVNSSTESVTVGIPSGVLQARRGSNRVARGGRTGPMRIRGRVQAAVYTVTGSSKRRAKGNSDPVIIIDT